MGLSAVIVLTTSQAQEPGRYEQWQASRPFTVGAMYYDAVKGPAAAWPPPSPHPDMDLFRQAGLNLLDDVSFSNGGHNAYPGVPAAQAAGVPFMILGAGWGANPLENFQSHVRFFADDPTWSGFCGVQLADEPRDPPQQLDYREQRDWLVKTYPHILTLICETLTYTPMWQKQVEVIQPDAVVYQWYPYHTSDVGQLDVSPGVYGCLGHASEFCTARGLGFFVTRGATSNQGASVLRLVTFAALAYGVQGFIDWYYDGGLWGGPRQETGYVWYEQGEGTPTRRFKRLAQINREVNHLSPALLKLRRIRTYHLDLESERTWAGPIYDFAETDELRTGKLQTVAATTDHLMVGFFRDENDEEYFMVVNKNHRARHHKDGDRSLLQDVTLTFAPQVTAIERLSRRTGEVERRSLKDHTFSFRLPGGTGDLFKYATDAPFAGSR